MVKKISNGRKPNSMWVSIAYGVAAAIVISLLGSIAGAIMLNRELVGESATFLLSMIIWIISAFIGTMVALKFSANQYLLVSGITVLIYVLVLIGVSIMFFDGKFAALWQGSVAVLIGGGLALMICSRKNTEKRHKVKYRSK